MLYIFRLSRGFTWSAYQQVNGSISNAACITQTVKLIRNPDPHDLRQFSFMKPGLFSNQGSYNMFAHLDNDTLVHSVPDL